VNWDKKLSIVLMIILCCLTITAVSAANNDNATVTSSDIPLNHSSNLNVLSIDNDLPDVPDYSDDVPDVPDLDNSSDIVTPSNIQMYFHNGVLKNQYAGKKLTFSGNFDNLGALSIKANDVSIVGLNAVFKNTVFDIEGNGVILNNLTFDLNKPVKDNDGAAILVHASDVSLIGLNIYYIVPNDVEAYGIYADGYTRYSSECLKIINSTIYFEGHNENVNRYNCAVKLTNAYAPVIENNTIISSLPLKNVNYGFDGATLDSDFVYTLGLEECPEFIIRNNVIISDVNKRPAVKFPTLNGIMLSKSDDGLFEGNSVHMTDFVTYPGTENYIYGLDIYKLNNLKVIGNDISIVTTGGKLALGTAYPIQICGPITGVNITKNDLYSFSNGPNIGIYSQNFYGETDLSITNNKINVTGLAGTHEWALVTGIETQDSTSEILNNIIEVHSISTVNVDDNLYAISYRQSTTGEHSFNIQNNTAFTDGYYGIYLLSSDNSKIINNILISSNSGAVTGSDAYAKGSRTHNGDTAYNNRVITMADYYNSHNTIDVGQNTDVRNSNSIQWNNLPWVTPSNHNVPTYNPLVPHYSNTNENPSDQQGNGGNSDYIDDGSVQGTLGDAGEGDNNYNNANSQNYNQNSAKNNKQSTVYSNVINSTDINGFDVNTPFNSSDASPSIGSDSPLGKSMSSGSSQESQSVSKAYEIEKLVSETENFIPSIFFIIAALILLVIGYKRKNSSFETN